MGLAYQLEINAFPLPARAELRWRHDGAHYEASLSLLSLLSIVRTSKGAITPQGLEPLRYGEKITARGETAVHFQRDKGVVSFSNNKPSVALLPGVQDELSVFFQIAALLGGDPALPRAMIEAVAQCLPSGHRLKVIIESGELGDPAFIDAASRIAIGAGAHFIKTSTGKTPVSATPAAARVMLTAIRDMGKPVGFKASGGIRTLADAQVYLDIADEIMGPDWATPDTFRFGASGLLDALLAALKEDGA
jgi:deoxyribose-phosphate aldolase